MNRHESCNLVFDVIGASGRSDVKVRADVERLDVPSSKAAPLGLIINELITNAIKHAFANGRSGALQVSARAQGEMVRIMIRDDGRGMEMDGVRVDGLGRTLIRRLCKQVQATATWENVQPGTSVTLVFPIAG